MDGRIAPALAAFVLVTTAVYVGSILLFPAVTRSDVVGEAQIGFVRLDSADRVRFAWALTLTLNDLPSDTQVRPVVVYDIGPYSDPTIDAGQGILMMLNLTINGEPIRVLEFGWIPTRYRAEAPTTWSTSKNALWQPGANTFAVEATFWSEDPTAGRVGRVPVAAGPIRIEQESPPPGEPLAGGIRLLGIPLWFLAPLTGTIAAIVAAKVLPPRRGRL